MITYQAPGGYTPPAVDTRLADAFCRSRQGADDLARALRELPADAPLWAAVDITAAIAHLRAAGRLVDRVAARITAEELAR